MNNLLCNLRRWARRQDENFLTEAFAFLLNYLLDHDPRVGEGLLQWLCSEPDDPLRFNSLRPKITTHCTTDDGRPDIRIVAPKEVFALIEVKKWSGLGADQLKRYWKIVRESEARFQSLVLLTVSKVEYPQGTEHASTERRWPDLADWLRKQPLSGKVAEFLVHQFLEFLKEQGMTMEIIGKEYINGTKAFRHLITMLETALKKAKIPDLKTANPFWTQNWIGFYLDANKFAVGVNYDSPENVQFRFWPTTKLPTEFDQQAFEKLGREGMHENMPWRRAKMEETIPYWELKLDSEETGFFGRSADSQLLLLTDFVTNAYHDAKACLGEP